MMFRFIVLLLPEENLIKQIKQKKNKKKQQQKNINDRHPRK